MGTDSRRVIRISSLKIRLEDVGVLEAELQALQKGNIGIRVLKEINITKGIHTRYSSGQKVCVMDAEIRHRVRIAIV